MSKKINQPESSFVLGLAYDSFKCSKILQGILSHLNPSEIENTECKKEITELAAEISTFTKIVSTINNLSPLLSCEILSELINMEDLLNETYANYLQSSTTKFVADEFSALIPQSSNNFKRIFECFVEEKEAHRQTLIEVIYNLESKEAERVTARVTCREISKPRCLVPRINNPRLHQNPTESQKPTISQVFLWPLSLLLKVTGAIWLHKRPFCHRSENSSVFSFALELVV